MTNNINSNNRSDFILKNFSDLNTQRIVSLALPFLALHSKTAALSSVGVGLYQCYTLWNTTADKTSTGSKWGDAALLVSSAGLGYIFPTGQLIFSSVVFFVQHAQKLRTGENWEETTYQIVSQIVHLASTYYGTPKWVVLSLLSQVASELNKAHQHYNKKETPEALANVILAGIRGYKASTYLPRELYWKPSIEKTAEKETLQKELSSIENPSLDASTESEIQKNKNTPTPAIEDPAKNRDEPTQSESPSAPANIIEEQKEIAVQKTEPSKITPARLRDITNDEWKALYEKHLAKRDPPQRLHLYTLLKLEGYSEILRDIDFTQTNSLRDLNLENLNCCNCNFSKVHFDNATFENFKANNCKFIESRFSSTKICGSDFNQCDFSAFSWDTSISYYGNTIIDCGGNPAFGTPIIQKIKEPSSLPIKEIAALEAPKETPALPLKKLTQDDWDKFSTKLPSRSWPLVNERCDVGALLKLNGFLIDLEGLDLSNKQFNNCDFQDMKFKNCKFNHAQFTSCSWYRAMVENCSFKRSSWHDSTIRNSTFNICNILKSSFRKPNYKSDDPKAQLIDFDNVEFNQCDLYKSRFVGLRMNEVKALNKSSLQKVYFDSSLVENSSFTACDLSLSTFYKSCYEKTSFIDCNLIESNWTRTSLDQITIQEGKLTESSFLHAKVKNSRLIDCDLKDAMLLDAKEGFEIQGGIPHQITKPIVALGWSFEGSGHYTCLIRKALKNCGALILPYEQDVSNSYEFEKSSLHAEVIQTLNQTTTSEEDPELSIAQQLLRDAPTGLEIDRLKQAAQEILKHANGLIIPGGEDVEPFFYKQSCKPDKFHYRTIIELALLSEANLRKVPTMGICRGAQIINVFFGGTLKNVEGQHGKRQLEWTNSQQGEKLRRILPNEFRAQSAHDQAVDHVGKGLNIVLKRGKVPKLLLSNDGNFIASQVHPESYIQTFESFGERFKMDETSYTYEDLNLVKKINVDIQKKIQDVHNLYPNSPFAKKFIEQVDKSFSILSRNIDFVFNNKNIYRFFLNKVERFRKERSESVPGEGE